MRVDSSPSSKAAPAQANELSEEQEVFLARLEMRSTLSSCCSEDSCCGFFAFVKELALDLWEVFSSWWEHLFSIPSGPLEPAADTVANPRVALKSEPISEKIPCTEAAPEIVQPHPRAADMSAVETFLENWPKGATPLTKEADLFYKELSSLPKDAFQAVKERFHHAYGEKIEQENHSTRIKELLKCDLVRMKTDDPLIRRALRRWNMDLEAKK